MQVHKFWTNIYIFLSYGYGIKTFHRTTRDRCSFNSWSPISVQGPINWQFNYKQQAVLYCPILSSGDWFRQCTTSVSKVFSVSAKNSILMSYIAFDLDNHVWFILIKIKYGVPEGAPLQAPHILFFICIVAKSWIDLFLNLLGLDIFGMYALWESCHGDKYSVLAKAMGLINEELLNRRDGLIIRIHKIWLFFFYSNSGFYESKFTQLK